MDEKFGPVALSLKREKLDESTSLLNAGDMEGNQYQYRIIARTSEVGSKALSFIQDFKKQKSLIYFIY